MALRRLPTLWNEDCRRITISRWHAPQRSVTSVTRKAGSIVLTRLRDRIRLGRYFGRWDCGDRLPSVRDVAELEAVDRKTAAAAYHRLEEEGLVQVRARSGVYLEGKEEQGTDPLRRLHLSWLERTLSAAEELGLDPVTVHRMFQGVSAVQQRRIPVVDPDTGHATLLARELSTRTGLDCVPTEPGRLPAEVGPLRDPPFILATPRGAERLSALRDRVPIVLITLSQELFQELCEACREEQVTVIVGSGALKAELEDALDRGLAEHPERIEVVGSDDPDEEDPLGGEEWGRHGPSDGRRVLRWRMTGLVAQTTLEAVRGQVARAALDHVSRSSASATRSSTV